MTLPFYAYEFEERTLAMCMAELRKVSRYKVNARREVQWMINIHVPKKHRAQCEAICKLEGLI